MVWKNQGVTLIELLIVIAVLGIILAVSLPDWGGTMDRHALEKEASRMAWTLRSARQEAITSGRSEMVRFLPTAGRYTYKGKTTELEHGIRFIGLTTFKTPGSSLIYCQFTMTGAPSPRGGTVALGNRSGEILYVIVNPAGGRVRVSDENPNF